MKYQRELVRPNPCYSGSKVGKAFAVGMLGILLPLSAGAQSVPVLQVQSHNLWEALRAGGWVMVPLGLLSILTVSLILIYLFMFRKRNMVTERFLQTADALTRKGDYLGLLAVSTRHNELVARIMQRVLEFWNQHPEAAAHEVREIAETEGTRQIANMNQQVIFLADIGTLAPMLGLLGTIFGMIKSFGAVAGHDAATRATFLAQGIAEALIATATGLIIGVVAMAAYSYFRGRVQVLIAELEGASTHLITSLTTRSARQTNEG